MAIQTHRKISITAEIRSWDEKERAKDVRTLLSCLSGQGRPEPCVIAAPLTLVQTRTSKETGPQVSPLSALSPSLLCSPVAGVLSWGQLVWAQGDGQDGSSKAHA